jgi:hypothetical protein
MAITDTMAEESAVRALQNTKNLINSIKFELHIDSESLAVI